MENAQKPKSPEHLMKDRCSFKHMKACNSFTVLLLQQHLLLVCPTPLQKV